ncbi:MAG: hypothetical protein ACE37F_03595 [Nannocystaceae bacterium]|nr:hypothetical protein [bacterium]
MGGHYPGQDDTVDEREKISMRCWGRTVAAAAILVAGCGDDIAGASGTDGGTGSTTPDDATTEDPTSQTEGVDASSSSESGDSEDPTTGGEEPLDPVPLEGPSVSLGFGGACQVSAEGTMQCWGSGRCGFFGDGSGHARGPAVIDERDTWSSVSLGWAHGCGVDFDGALWCWGDGREGRVGDGNADEVPFSSSCRLDRVELEPLGGWAQVSAGDGHSCAVRADGTLWCWGSNEFGQIGDGALGGLYTRLSPVQVGPADDWLEVFAGDEHSCARRRDETVWCWGHGSALGDGTEVGVSSQPVMVAGPATWRALPRGTAARHTCAIDTEGEVWCWGQTSGGALGPAAETESEEPVAVSLRGEALRVSVGADTSCAVLEDASVWCWGRNRDGMLGLPLRTERSFEPVQPHPGLEAVDVRVGVAAICVTDESGRATCWGNNELGEVGDHTSGSDNSPRLDPAPVGTSAVEASLDDWVAVSAGAGHSCGIRNDDSLWCWGSRGGGRLGNADTTEDCSPANPLSCHVTTPVPVAGGHAWSAVAVGTVHTCGITQGGALYCWGRDDLGGTGVGDANVPTEVVASTSWTSIAAGSGHSCGVQTDGTLWCWGSGFYGELGLGTQGAGVFEETPVQVGVETDWSVVVSGGRHDCGLRGESLWCWGDNTSGQVGNGEETSDMGVGAYGVADPFEVVGTWSHVAAGGGHTCALDDAGALWCWGRNTSGELGYDPDGLEQVSTPTQVGVDTDWDALALGHQVSCGTKTDGTLHCWGSREDGRLGDGIIALDSVSWEPVQVGADDNDDDAWIGASASGRTVCASRADGSAWCWGANSSGQRGDDTVFESAVPRRVVQ